MAVELLIRKWLDGQSPAPGARAALGALALADYDGAFARRTIKTGWGEEGETATYPAVLGPAFAALPGSLHGPGPRAVWQGRAEVTRGKGLIAGLVARLFGFPQAGEQPVTVTLTSDATGRETWAGQFGTSHMQSTQEAGQGKLRHLIVERFGPFPFGIALHWHEGRLQRIPRRWSLLGLPLLRALMPGGETWEEETGGRLHFHVEITQPLMGQVVRHAGWLEPED